MKRTIANEDGQQTPKKLKSIRIAVKDIVDNGVKMRLKGHNEQALDDFNNALKVLAEYNDHNQDVLLFEQYERVYIEASKCHYKDGKYDDAVKCYDEINERAKLLNNNDILAQSYWKRACLLKHIKRFGAALEDVNRVVTAIEQQGVFDYSGWYYYCERGYILLQLERYPEALEDFDKALEKGKKNHYHATVWNLQEIKEREIDFYIGSGHAGFALKPDIYLGLGHAYIELKNDVKALENYLNYLKYRKSDKGVYFYIAYIKERNNNAEALEDYNTFIEFVKKNIELAKKDPQKLKKEDKDNLSCAYNNRAYIYEKTADYKAAIADYEAAIEKDRIDALYYYKIGRCFIKANNLAKAEEQLSMAIDIDIGKLTVEKDKDLQKLLEDLPARIAFLKEIIQHNPALQTLTNSLNSLNSTFENSISTATATGSAHAEGSSPQKSNVNKQKPFSFHDAELLHGNNSQRNDLNAESYTSTPAPLTNSQLMAYIMDNPSTSDMSDTLQAYPSSSKDLPRLAKHSTHERSLFNQKVNQKKKSTRNEGNEQNTTIDGTQDTVADEDLSDVDENTIKERKSKTISNDKEAKHEDKTDIGGKGESFVYRYLKELFAGPREKVGYTLKVVYNQRPSKMKPHRLYLYPEGDNVKYCVLNQQGQLEDRILLQTELGKYYDAIKDVLQDKHKSLTEKQKAAVVNIVHQRGYDMLEPGFKVKTEHEESQVIWFNKNFNSTSPMDFAIKTTCDGVAKKDEYIEVKATSSSKKKKAPAEISREQIKWMRECRERVTLFRVYDVHETDAKDKEYDFQLYHDPAKTLLNITGYTLKLCYQLNPENDEVEPHKLYLYCIDELLEFAVSIDNIVIRLSLSDDMLNGHSDAIKAILKDTAQAAKFTAKQKDAIFNACSNWQFTQAKIPKTTTYIGCTI